MKEYNTVEFFFNVGPPFVFGNAGVGYDGTMCERQKVILSTWKNDAFYYLSLFKNDLWKHTPLYKNEQMREELTNGDYSLPSSEHILQNFHKKANLFK